MNSFRLVFAIVAGCCLLRPVPLPADDAPPPPFTMDKHYAADLQITTKQGMQIESKTFVDGDKMRSDVHMMNGMEMAIIVRKDQKKIYQVMDAQKMVLESDLDANKTMASASASFGPEGKFVLVGPDVVDGVPTTKYKVTSDKNNQVFFFWLDAARKVPLQMAAADGSLVVRWTNYTSGPQAPALFEVPSGYNVMQMPSGGMPGAPGGP